MRRCTLLATILMVSASCDKAKSLGGGEGSTEAATPAAPSLDLSERPDILFQVFGERDDPRMIPVAALQNGSIRQIELSENGWRAFDSLYTRSGASYSLYRDGQNVGTVLVRQGMWEKPEEPLYSLPNCRRLTPLASVGVQTTADVGFTLELMASSAQLGSAAKPPVNSAALVAAARSVAYTVGADASIQKSQLDPLDFRSVAIHTGATSEPTLISAFIDRQADADAGSTRAVHVFAVADKNPAGYAPTFSHAANGPASTAEYRRYVDHLDMTGDGVDEIILEGWKSGGDTFLTILGFSDGQWSEVYRGRPSWCLDVRASR
jgi:hypothetical protein